MKKKFLVLMCCVTLGLVGCGSEKAKDDNAVTEEVTTAETETEEATTEDTQTEETASEASTTEAQTEAKPVSDADVGPEVGAVPAYYEDGTEVLLTENTDGTYLSGDGAVYYLGTDGVYRAGGHEDLYKSNPKTSGKESTITETQALEAIKKYCFTNDPGLEDMMKSGDNSAYFDVSTNENGEIVVLYRSYTAAQIRYYVNANSGAVYVTELVPGIIDEEQRTDESFNIKDYMN